MNRSCRRILFGSSLVAALVVATATFADGFVSGIEDLPLMQGLEETEGGMVFDSPAGRIVEAVAVGKVSREDVLDFYIETLPQLGWTPAGQGVFRREGEVLRIEFPGRDGSGTTVRFALSPEGHGG